MNRTGRKKLALSRETLKRLEPEVMRAIAGGTETNTCTTYIIGSCMCSIPGFDPGCGSGAPCVPTGGRKCLY